MSLPASMSSRPHQSLHGGVVVLRPALDALEADEDPVPEAPEEAVGLPATILELVEIGPPLVDPNDEAFPTWVEELHTGSVEIIDLAEALHRVAEAERAELVAEHIAELAELVSHHRTVTETPPAGGSWCMLCIADTESHAAALATAIVWRSSELIDALTLFGPGLLCDNAVVAAALQGRYQRPA